MGWLNWNKSVIPENAVGNNRGACLSQKNPPPSSTARLSTTVQFDTVEEAFTPT